MVFVNVIQPGKGIDLSQAAPPEIEPGSVSDVVLSMVPENIFESLSSASGLLAVIFFSILVGVATALVGEPAKPFRSFFVSAERVVLRITEWILLLTPIGVGALLYTAIVDLPPGELARLPLYVGTVVGALATHALVTLPLLLWLVGRRNPFKALGAMFPALATAFSTASSSATLPKTMECAEQRAGVSPRVTGFVLPLGATVNMDGTALYEAVAAIFVAQAYGMDLTFGSQLLVFLTATLAAIGAAGVPSAGLVTMVIVFETVGLPIEGIGIILAVDRILDMLRTTVNVWGDSCGSMVLDRWFGDAATNEG
jgi:Na+/H+-dicarboxylate symporter